MPARFRALRSALLGALLLALLGAGCGRERAAGGSGALHAGLGGSGQLLRLKGTPYEMGWWHGHLLKAKVVARAEAAARLQPADYIETFADQALHRLSERMRQELDGIAAGAGVLPLDLMKAEVAPEVLRFKGTEPGLLGAAGLAPSSPEAEGGGISVIARYAGRGAPAFAREALLIHRMPTGGTESLSLARPGSIGAGSTSTAAATATCSPRWTSPRSAAWASAEAARSRWVRARRWTRPRMSISSWPSSRAPWGTPASASATNPRNSRPCVPWPACRSTAHRISLGAGRAALPGHRALRGPGGAGCEGAAGAGRRSRRAVRAGTLAAVVGPPARRRRREGSLGRRLGTG